MEKEHYEAIIKGRYDLLDSAKARINFLKGKVDTNLLRMGVEGDKESLHRIHWIFMNYGWWEKARNLNIKSMGYFYGEESERRAQEEEEDLINFIFSKEYMVHPNVLKMVNKRDSEGIRMALNHIHYGSLKASRDLDGLDPNSVKERQQNNQEEEWTVVSKRRPISSSEKPSHRVEQKSTSKKMAKMDIERNFIKSNGHLVNSWILKEALTGEDFFINRALFQIHSNSLNLDTDTKKRSQGAITSYKEALLSAPPNKKDKIEKTPSYSALQNRETKVVFVSNIPHEALLKDIWQHFKKFCPVKDIILPRKCDKHGKRYGFIKVQNHNDASLLIKNISGHLFKGNTLKLDFALKKNFKNQNPLSGDANSEKTSSKPTETTSDTRHERASPQEKGSHSPTVNIGKKIEHDRTLTKELESSIIVETLSPSLVSEVINQLDMLGYDNVLVRGLSKFKFLLTFIEYATFKNLDMGLLELGFIKCELVNIESLIIPRLAWVEISGLPVNSWCIDTFKNLLQAWGKIVSISDKLDEDFCYTNPIIGISTNKMNKILNNLDIQLEGKNWPIWIKEVNNQETSLGISKDYDTIKINEEDTIHNEDTSTEDEGTMRGDEVSKDSLDGTDIETNPEIPISDPTNNSDRLDQFRKDSPYRSSRSDNAQNPTENSVRDLVLPNCLTDLQDDTFGEMAWAIRDESNSTSSGTVSKAPSNISSISLPQASTQISENSLGAVVQHFGGLKPFKKRGRPRKFSNKTVKAFQLPMRTKNMKHLYKCARNYTKEAEIVLESSSLMGLSLVGTKEEALSNIISRLKY